MKEEFIILTDETYRDFNQPVVVPSLYIMGNNHMGGFFVQGEEDLNAEMLKYAEQSGAFDFLSNPDEDLYTFNDGQNV